MLKNILFFIVPTCVYFISSFFISDVSSTLLVTFVLSAIIFWAGSLIPEYQTSLYFLFGTLFFGLAPKEIIFSGFYSSAFWLVFSGIIITIAMKNINLNTKMLHIFNIFSIDSYAKILIFTVLFATLLCFIIPSSLSRIFVTIPILLSVCSNFGYEKDSKAYIGIMLLGIMATSLPGFVILPANLPNMILAGLTENIYDFKLLYSDYLISNFFIFGVLKLFITFFIIYFYFKEEPKQTYHDTNKLEVKKNEKLISFILFAIVLLWISDSYHKLAPSFVAVLGSLVLLHPSLKIINKKDLSSINLPMLIFVAGLIGLGNIVAHNDFIKESLETFIKSYEFSNNSSFTDYMAITVFTTLSGIVLTQPTIPPLFTPLAGELSNLTGFSLNEIFMMQVASFSNIFFIHQSPPILIAVQLAFLKPAKMLKMLLIIAGITTVTLYPLHYIWLMFLR